LKVPFHIKLSTFNLITFNMTKIESARLWYPANDPVHGFDHVLRVYHLAERLAQAEGADLEIVRAAALLHDANSSQPSAVSRQPSPSGVAANGDALHDTRHTQSSIHNLQSTINNRQTHHHSSASFAAQVLSAEGWDEARIAAVQHCIRAHRFRDREEPPQTLEAKVLFDADKLDAIGAVGVARAIGYAVQAGQPPYAPASPQFIETGELAPGEPHSAYHEYLFKLRHIQGRMLTASGRLLAQERHRWMAEFFEQLAQEMRT
jgi:uncharacterized protein